MAGGDEASFTEIYHRYRQELSGYALNITRNREDAADIVHELFISVWKRRAQLTINTSLRAYLFSSIRNLSARYIQNNIRKNNFLEGFSAVVSGSEIVFAAGQLEAKEITHQLATVIAAMPKKMQQVYLMSREEQLSHREIADRLNLAESTVKKQIQNALKLIKDQLGDLSVIAILLIGRF